MSKVIKFTNVSEEQLQMLCDLVVCMIVDDGVVLVPFDELVERDGSWVDDLVGEVVSIQNTTYRYSIRVSIVGITKQDKTMKVVCVVVPEEIFDGYYNTLEKATYCPNTETMCLPIECFTQLMTHPMTIELVEDEDIDIEFIVCQDD